MKKQNKWNKFREWFHNEFYCGRKLKPGQVYNYINLIGDKVFEIDSDLGERKIMSLLEKSNIKRVL